MVEHNNKTQYDIIPMGMFQEINYNTVYQGNL